MARAKGWPGQGKSQSFTRLVTFQVNRGALVAQSAPRKRGRPKSPVTREQNEWFRQANQAAKYAPSDDQWMTIRIAKDGPWYPRDLMMSAMRGRLFEVLIIDGQEYRAVATRDDVSNDLDFLAGFIPGTIIVRGTNGWTALVPGAAGEALVTNGAGSAPAWSSGVVASGNLVTQNIPTATATGSAFATKGFPFQVGNPFTLKRMGVLIEWIFGFKYRGAVFRIDATGKILALEGETAEITANTTGLEYLSEPLLTPAALSLGRLYVIAWSRTDGADIFPMPIRVSALPNSFPGLPVEPFGLLASVDINAKIAKAQPQVNDTFGLFTNGSFFQQFTIAI